jgi:peptide/nickel transport system permease protein
VTAEARPVDRGRPVGDLRCRSRIPRNIEILLSSGTLALILAACFLGPLLGRLASPVGGDLASAGLPAGSPQHPLGTDMLGNDLLARVLAGGRLSLEVAFGSTVLGLSVGGLVGTVAGYVGGPIDRAAGVALDVLIAFPAAVLALVVAAELGPGELHLILALSLFGVPVYARLARTAAAGVRRRRFLRAAELFGATRARIVLTHLVPNVVPRLLTFGCLGLSVTIVLEAWLSYTGLGLRPPAPSWGTMIVQGQEYLTIRPSLVIVPGALLTLTALALNVLGDAVRARLAGS